jgi:hypothetical protein
MSDVVQTEEFRVDAEGIETRTFSSRQIALEQFRQCVGGGGWCEVWECSTEVNSAVKIADFPGLSRK